MPPWLGCCFSLFFFSFLLLFFFTRGISISYFYWMFHIESVLNQIFLCMSVSKCLSKGFRFGGLCAPSVCYGIFQREEVHRKGKSKLLFSPESSRQWSQVRCPRRRLWLWGSVTVLARFMLQWGLRFKMTCLFVCLLFLYLHLSTHFADSWASIIFIC